MGDLFRCLQSFAVTESWGVGVAEAPVAEIVRRGRLPPVRWLPGTGPDRWLADPFGWEQDGRIHLLAEEMDLRRAKGRIAAATLDGAGGLAGGWRPAIEAPAHLSFPALFRHAGALYAAPESWEAGALSAWRLEAAPGRWAPAGPLIQGIAAVDPALVEHGGCWWLFCSDRGGDPDRDLLLFEARDPFAGWTPHPGNPVKRDRAAARMAGPLFRLGTDLFRPAQDCGRRYGAAVVLHRVTRLDSGGFAEEPVCRLAPDPDGPYPDGLHTLCPAGPVTLVDGLRRRAHWRALPARLRLLAANRRRRAAL